MAEGRPKIEFARATADHTGICQPCNLPTNRLVAFRPEGAPRHDGFFMCDECLEGIRAMGVRKPADA